MDDPTYINYDVLLLVTLAIYSQWCLDALDTRFWLLKVSYSLFFLFLRELEYCSSQYLSFTNLGDGFVSSVCWEDVVRRRLDLRYDTTYHG